MFNNNRQDTLNKAPTYISGEKPGNPSFLGIQPDTAVFPVVGKPTAHWESHLAIDRIQFTGYGVGISETKKRQIVLIQVSPPVILVRFGRRSLNWLVWTNFISKP